MNQVKQLLKINPSNLTEDTYTNTQTLVVPTGLHYLSDVLEDLPKGVFIDKQVCGVGGTTLAIKSDTNYVIAVHRKLLVENKHIQHPDILVKATQGVGMPRLLSGKKFPVPSMSLQPIIPVFSCQFLVFSILEKVSSATTVSGFKTQIYSPLA